MRTRLRGDSPRHSAAAEAALNDAYEGLVRAHDAVRQGDCTEATSQFGGAMLSLGAASQEIAWGNRPDLRDGLQKVSAGLSRFAARELRSCRVDPCPESSAAPGPTLPGLPDLDEATWHEMQCALLRRRIERHSDNRSSAAASLRVPRATFTEWTGKCGILKVGRRGDHPDFERRP